VRVRLRACRPGTDAVGGVQGADRLAPLPLVPRRTLSSAGLVEVLRRSSVSQPASPGADGADRVAGDSGADRYRGVRSASDCEDDDLVKKPAKPGQAEAAGGAAAGNAAPAPVKDASSDDDLLKAEHEHEHDHAPIAPGDLHAVSSESSGAASLASDVAQHAVPQGSPEASILVHGDGAERADMAPLRPASGRSAAAVAMDAAVRVSEARAGAGADAEGEMAPPDLD
jgi:hypothetical protein